MKPAWPIALVFAITVSYCVAAQDSGQFTPDEQFQTITAENAAQLSPIQPPVIRVATSPDGQFTAVAGTQDHSDDFSLSIVWTKSGNRFGSIQSGEYHILSDVVWSPDSRYLALVLGRGAMYSDRAVQVFEIEACLDKTCTTSFPPFVILDPVSYGPPWKSQAQSTVEHPIMVTWSPDNQMIAVAFYDRLKVYNLGSEEPVFKAVVPGIWYVDWSADGHTITTRTDSGAIQQWSVPVSPYDT